MIIRECSDLHLEFLGDYKSYIAKNSRDWNSSSIIPVMEDESQQILILAGDIIMIKYVEKFRQFFQDISKRFKQIIIVSGNHELYRYNFLTGQRDYKNFLKDFPNITLLENEIIIVDDIAIFGSTLWTNFNKRNSYSMGYAPNAMSDFQVIEYSPEDGSAHGRWTPELSVLEHEKSIESMTKFFKDYKDKKKIIISHHCPSQKSCDLKFWGSPLNAAFYSDLEDLITKYKPNIWIHGHTHNSCNYDIGDTRVICNPRGYNNGDENPEFNSQFIINI